MAEPPPGVSEIVVQGLRRRFGAVWALAGVDLIVARGELFAIVGPDGSGKTSLVQSICAILDPTEGRVTVSGLDSVRDAGRLWAEVLDCARDGRRLPGVEPETLARKLRQMTVAEQIAALEVADRVAVAAGTLRERLAAAGVGDQP